VGVDHEGVSFMQCVANYEIRSELSVFEDGRWLKLQHPNGLFRARIRNIIRSDFSGPFLLSLHLAFDAPSLEEAKDVAEERLADCLNMLALTTGSAFVRHRIRQIVDGTPGGPMRSCLMWGDAIEHENPTPFLDDQIMASTERLLAFDAPPAVRQAMRWYRIGVNASIPDDQFQYFWFALELVAIAQGSSEKVPDRCPRCRAPLFCETCKEHPVHRPYEKQKIQAVIKAVDKDCDDATQAKLEDARNALMHGRTLKEIEENLSQPREEIVDTLGRIVLKALINQFPPEIFKEKFVFGNPTTYIHRTLTGIAHVQTVVPVDAAGEFDLSFTGVTMAMVTDAPPQSARPTLMGMTLDQHRRLGRLGYGKGDQQDMCRRIYQRAQIQSEHVLAVVFSTDMVRILDAVKRGDAGDWQDLFREIIGNGQPKRDARI
jgi:hypothetical protein